MIRGLQYMPSLLTADLQVWEAVTGSKATDQTLIVLSGIAKVFVGDLIEAGALPTQGRARHQALCASADCP